MDFAAAPVVAHVDGSESSIAVVQWAVDEASGRGIGVRLLAILDPCADGEAAAAAARGALRVAAAAARACDEHVAVQCATVRGDVLDTLVEESRSAAMICLAATSRAARMAPLTKSPVALVRRRRSHPPTPADRWVVAVMGQSSSASTVLRVAISEARVRHAAVMALVPPGYEPEACLAEINGPLESTGTGADIEIWALPQPRDVVAMLLQSPELEHLVVTEAENQTLLHAFVDDGVMPALPENFSLLLVPNRTGVTAEQRDEECALVGH